MAFNVAMITIAQLTSSIMAYLIKPDWRMMLGIATVPAIIQFIGMLCMPESPRWLGKEGRFQEQLQVMTLIYKPQSIGTANRHLSNEV